MIQQPEGSDGVGFRLAGSHLPLGPAEPELRLVAGRPAAYTASLALDVPAIAGADNTPVLIERSVGKGRTHYLNLSLIDYAKWRLTGDDGPLRELVADIFTACGAAPAIKVTRAPDGGPPVGCEVITYMGDGCRYLAIMRNPEYRVGSLGEIGYTDNSRFEQPEQLVVEFDAPTHARDLLSDRDLGQTERVELTLDPWKPLILELRPPEA